MAPLSRALAERDSCRAYSGPDDVGALMGELDWESEASLIRREEYETFLAGKQIRAQAVGFACDDVGDGLFDFQGVVTRWALRRGRCAIFAGCGMGKTAMQLRWADRVSKHANAPVLIFAPLSVSRQTASEEGPKFGVPVALCASQADIRPGVNITNYEKFHAFDPVGLAGVVLDESSILKGFDGATRKAITQFASGIGYRLCATATPAPNDYMELGNHSEFLNVMTCAEMLATFFVHDGGETSKWRLKRHAEDEFWKWVCSWAVAIQKPSDLGFSDEKFTLPELRIEQITVPSSYVPDGYLFSLGARTLSERRDARRESMDARIEAAATVANEDLDSFLAWCDLNAEGDKLEDSIQFAEQVAGSDDVTTKEDRVTRFTRKFLRALVSKPSICGHGMNWQHCNRMAFVGLSDSWEQFYQAVRRCWRFGQTRPVTAYIITSDQEGAVVENIKRKEAQAERMMEGMISHMKAEMERNLKGTTKDEEEYATDSASGKGWDVRLGDSVELIRAIPDGSIHYSVYSPPFASLYTYTNSQRDMGNCRDVEEFAEHFRFLAHELFRVIMPGRLMSFHCMNLPATKQFDGFIGVKDFRGDLIRLFIEAGFIFHSEVCIWKDPVTAMQRTKAIGLLYKQLRKDSALSRQGIPDYLVTMRKPGANVEPVTKTHEGFPVDLWQKYASPVWMDIDPNDTLQHRSAREHEDERHICPLQLPVIQRGIDLWTNPDDLVLDPFAGIGSTGHVAIQRGRRFLGFELKRSYYKQAVANCAAAEKVQEGLFA